MYDESVFLSSQTKKRKDGRLSRYGNESYDFADDEEDLDIDAVDEEVSSKKDNDSEDPFDDLMSSKKRKYKEAIDHKEDDLQYRYRHLRERD